MATDTYISEVRILDAADRNDGSGFCRACFADARGIEPDARNLKCKLCGEQEVFGTDEMLQFTRREHGVDLLVGIRIALKEIQSQVSSINDYSDEAHPLMQSEALKNIYHLIKRIDHDLKR